MAGIYIHIPFCKQKCTYCDFASYPKEIGKAEAYFACLLKEISSRAEELKSKTFNTIYIGGGTPSFVKPEFIAAVLNKVRSRFNIEKNAEITIEMNPGTVDERKIEIYKRAGVNRFSVGLQSASDKRLLSLNRIHTRADFEEVCKLLKGENFSADVMIGLENQKNDEIKDTIDLAVNGGAKHISVYALQPEEGTPMFGKYLSGDLPGADETADMYDFARNYLNSLGFERYEVSNFAKPGYRSRHNINYWKRGEYIGLGVAASSCINNRRFTNTESIDEYVHCLLNDKYAEVYSEQIEGDEIISEYVMLALRTSDGINLADYTRNFGSDFLTDFKDKIELERPYLDITDDRVRIKDEYLFTQNSIIVNFI